MQAFLDNSSAGHETLAHVENVFLIFLFHLGRIDDGEANIGIRLIQEIQFFVEIFAVLRPGDGVVIDGLIICRQFW